MRITDSRIKSDVFGANYVSVEYCGAGIHSNRYEFTIKCPIGCELDGNGSRKSIGADIAAETINSAVGDGAFITIMMHNVDRSKSKLNELECHTFEITGAWSDGDFAVIKCEYKYQQKDPHKDAELISNASFVCKLVNFKGVCFLDIIETV